MTVCSGHAVRYLAGTMHERRRTVPSQHHDCLTGLTRCLHTLALTDLLQHPPLSTPRFNPFQHCENGPSLYPSNLIPTRGHRTSSKRGQGFGCPTPDNGIRRYLVYMYLYLTGKGYQHILPQKNPHLAPCGVPRSFDVDSGLRKQQKWT